MNSDRNLPPASLEHVTKEGLRVLMLLNNRRHSRQFHYFDFSFVNSKWHCWYEISETDRLTKGQDGIKSK